MKRAKIRIPAIYVAAYAVVAALTFPVSASAETHYEEGYENTPEGQVYWYKLCDSRSVTCTFCVPSLGVCYPVFNDVNWNPGGVNEH